MAKITRQTNRRKSKRYMVRIWKKVLILLHLLRFQLIDVDTYRRFRFNVKPVAGNYYETGFGSLFCKQFQKRERLNAEID